MAGEKKKSQREVTGTLASIAKRAVVEAQVALGVTNAIIGYEAILELEDPGSEDFRETVNRLKALREIANESEEIADACMRAIDEYQEESQRIMSEGSRRNANA